MQTDSGSFFILWDPHLCSPGLFSLDINQKNPSIFLMNRHIHCFRQKIFPVKLLVSLFEHQSCYFWFTSMSIFWVFYCSLNPAPVLSQGDTCMRYLRPLCAQGHGRLLQPVDFAAWPQPWWLKGHGRSVWGSGVHSLRGLELLQEGRGSLNPQSCLCCSSCCEILLWLLPAVHLIYAIY